MKRTDANGRDVTDLPGLWSDTDRLTMTAEEFGEQLDNHASTMAVMISERVVYVIAGHEDEVRCRHCRQPWTLAAVREIVEMFSPKAANVVRCLSGEYESPPDDLA